MELAEFRGNFPGLTERVYLNSASEGAMPEGAIREAARIGALKSRPWEIGTELWYELASAVRSRLESLLGAPPGSVAIMPGTSAGISVAARSAPLETGDEVLLLESQFPSNAYPWRAVLGKGATIRVVPRPLGADPTPAILGAIASRTRLVAIDWVNFIDGAVIDLAAVGAACRDHGALFVVDAAQGLGAIPIDVVAANVDVLAAPAHKWLLGPTGTGLLYVRPDLIDRLQSWNAGWVNVAAKAGFRNLLKLDGAPPDDASRFESGSPAMTMLAGWGASLDLTAALGPATIAGHLLALTDRLRAGLGSLEKRGVTLVSPHEGRAARSGIVAFSTRDRTAGQDRTAALYREIERNGITVAFREGMVRVSPHAYNTEAEIDALLGNLM